MNFKKLKEKSKNIKTQTTNVLLIRKKINIDGLQSTLFKNKYLGKGQEAIFLKSYLFGQLFWIKLPNLKNLTSLVNCLSVDQNIFVAFLYKKIIFDKQRMKNLLKFKITKNYKNILLKQIVQCLSLSTSKILYFYKTYFSNIKNAPTWR